VDRKHPTLSHPDLKALSDKLDQTKPELLQEPMGFSHRQCRDQGRGQGRGLRTSFKSPLKTHVFVSASGDV